MTDLARTPAKVLLKSFVGNKAKSESQNWCFKKTKHAKENKHTYVCVSRGKKYSFFRKFGVICFLETPVLRFALLPYYRPFDVCGS